MCDRGIQYHLCAVHIEDCEGWWLLAFVAQWQEHWRLKPGVLGSTACQLFTFLHSCLTTYIELYLQCMDVVLAPWNQSHHLLQLIVQDPTVLHVCKKIRARSLATTVEVTARAQVNSLLACDHKKVKKFHNEYKFSNISQVHLHSQNYACYAN